MNIRNEFMTIASCSLAVALEMASLSCSSSKTVPDGVGGGESDSYPGAMVRCVLAKEAYKD